MPHLKPYKQRQALLLEVLRIPLHAVSRITYSRREQFHAGLCHHLCAQIISRSQGVIIMRKEKTQVGTIITLSPTALPFTTHY